MDKSKIDVFLYSNAENFFPQDLMEIKARLETLDDEKFCLIQSAGYQRPSIILMLSLFMLERFFLADIALGVVKVVTYGGCCVWWLIDIFTAMDRAKRYNMTKFRQVLTRE